MNSPELTFTPAKPRVIRAFGDEATILQDGASTGGKLTAFVNLTPPGGGPPPHYHEIEDEWFMPLEGHFEFLSNGKWTAVPVGSIAFAPRQSIHTFRNSGESPGKILIQLSPSGFETFFERCAEEFAKPGPPSMERIIEISAEHGIHYV